MDKKKWLFPILLGVLAVILLAMLFLPGQETQVPAGTEGGRPAVQDQTDPAGSAQTDAPDDTGAETTGTVPQDRTEPDETDPDETQKNDPGRDDPEQTEPEQTRPPVQVQTAFPAELEDGMLTVRNMFQFTGMNPDVDNAFGEDIAGIELTNNSDRHMTYAEVTVIMADGAVLTFRAEDIPAGRTVMAFSLENGSVEDVSGCEEISGYAEYEDSDPLQTDRVQCSVDGIAITVKNLTNGTLTDLDVICHGLLDSSYFGGSTYHYNVTTLPAGASTVIYAEDCILGMTEVVRVELGG